MLVVRIESNSKIWEGVIAPKREPRILRILQTFAIASDLQGELLGLRVKSEDGRWLEVAGSMLGCEIETEQNKTKATVRFEADRWRTW